MPGVTRVFLIRWRHDHHKYRVDSVRVVWSEPSPPPDATTSPELFDHPRPVRIQRHPTTSINNRLGRVVFWWITADAIRVFAKIRFKKITCLPLKKVNSLPTKFLVCLR